MDNACDLKFMIYVAEARCVLEISCCVYSDGDYNCVVIEFVINANRSIMILQSYKHSSVELI